MYGVCSAPGVLRQQEKDEVHRSSEKAVSDCFDLC